MTTLAELSPVGDAQSPLDSDAPPPSAALRSWVAEAASLLEPVGVAWCDGSAEERTRLLALMVETGTLVKLDHSLRPDSYLARSTPDDVARVESRTFVCSSREADAGPNNNWRDPDEMRAELRDWCAGAMRGRTMYVVPFSMGPVGGQHSLIGVQITDSPYAVVATGTMTRMGAAVLELIDGGAPWIPALHTVGMPLLDDAGRRTEDVPWPCNERKTIAHFPDTGEIWSFGSGYGGNAILAKKCIGLRIASVIARREGWLAAHMLLVRLISPQGRRVHIAAAFPSACGKTNLAMMRPALEGWRVETLGDDITWLRRGPDGRLWAANPEAGLFGVAPGTGAETNPVAMETVRRNTVFTNVALTSDGDVWWEGMDEAAPSGLTDWRGEAWTGERPAAHPNGRFTVAMEECPSRAPDWDDPGGVPVDAVLFGGRRADTVPLITEAETWDQGVLMGATMSSQRTAAAEGPVGELRFDPFAMQPFCGYDLADHWEQWLAIGDRLGAGAPRVFRVNWFRRGDDGRFLWPGFGHNIRVLDWIVRRLDEEVGCVRTPVGLLPLRRDLRLDGSGVSDDDLDRLTGFDADEWHAELPGLSAHLRGYGDRVPSRVRDELTRLTRGVWASIR